jgi:hypothetical protein
MLLQAFYSVCSERHLMERIEFDPLFRWFVGVGIDDRIVDSRGDIGFSSLGSRQCIRAKKDRQCSLDMITGIG